MLVVQGEHMFDYRGSYLRWCVSASFGFAVAVVLSIVIPLTVPLTWWLTTKVGIGNVTANAVSFLTVWVVATLSFRLYIR